MLQFTLTLIDCSFYCYSMRSLSLSVTHINTHMYTHRLFCFICLSLSLLFGRIRHSQAYASFERRLPQAGRSDLDSVPLTSSPFSLTCPSSDSSTTDFQKRSIVKEEGGIALLTLLQSESSTMRSNKDAIVPAQEKYRVCFHSIMSANVVCNFPYPKKYI